MLSRTLPQNERRPNHCLPCGPRTPYPAGVDEDALRGVLAPLRSALERRGYTALTAVQRAVLDAETDRRDLRISSQTGSGKTVALGLVVAPSLIEGADDRPGPIVLVLTPTRELAAQVRTELAFLYEDMPVDVEVVTGGKDPVRERKALKARPAVLVATPGRLLDHLRAGAVDLSAVRHGVLDEADQMLDLGFRDELDAILGALPEGRSLHMVSATFAREVLRFADRYQRDFLHIEGTRLGAANQDIEHVAYLVLAEQRHRALINLLLTDYARGRGSCLVFVRRRLDTSELAELLAEDGFSAMPFSGELSQAQRDRTLNAFKRGLVRVLVATDVAARGIDVQDISTVVHFDLPTDAETFTHRSGRTGRAGQKGRSLILVPPSAEWRVRRLLEQARVAADWSAVPDARRIEKAVLKTTRRALQARLDAAEELAQKQLTFSEALLAKHDPTTLVAVLLDMANRQLPREPVEVRHLEPREDGPSRSPRDRPRPFGARRGGPRGRARGRGARSSRGSRGVRH